MTEEEITTFNEKGQQALTRFAAAVYDLQIWSEAFEQRGGTPVFENDALEIVLINNALQEMLTAPRKATIARLRTDV